MTTGRINQVTILQPRPAARKGHRVIGENLVKCWGGNHPAERLTQPRTESRRSATGHPFATTEFSRAVSAEEGRTKSAALPHRRPRRRLPIAGHSLRKAGYQFTSVPPNASLKSMASGQQPTNPIGASPLAISGVDFERTHPAHRRVT